MRRIVLFNKPYGALSLFTPEGGHRGLSDYIDLPGVYAAGRLDAASEGRMILTDDGAVQHRLANRCFKQPKTYWVRVEGMPEEAASTALRRGVVLKDGPTRPAQARRLDAPASLWPRDPPVRYRRALPSAWLALTITEGRNRQVRRMTAHVGYPTLRPIRWSVGDWTLADLAPGKWRLVGPAG